MPRLTLKIRLADRKTASFRGKIVKSTVARLARKLAATVVDYAISMPDRLTHTSRGVCGYISTTHRRAYRRVASMCNVTEESIGTFYIYHDSLISRLSTRQAEESNETRLSLSFYLSCILELIEQTLCVSRFLPSFLSTIFSSPFIFILLRFSRSLT